MADKTSDEDMEKQQGSAGSEERAVKERIAWLEKEIKRHQELYYNGEPEITDEEFDALWDELSRLDPGNALLRSIGRDISERWPKRDHVMVMGSLSKATDPESFRQWASKVHFPLYLVQYKLDGASMELQYQNGKFIAGVTRGDGLVGDDITSNVRKMHGVVLQLPEPYTGAVRGEVVMSHEIHRSKYADKANCRNAANGLMKRKDGEGSEDLDIIVYDAFGTTNGEIPWNSSERKKIQWLKSAGFTTVETAECGSPDEVILYRAHIMDIRNSLPYDIDGLVVKGDVIDIEDARNLRPEKAIAFKFSPEEAVTTLREVEWSESGSTVTPIGIVEPVRLAGTLVQRANLCNPDMIRSLDLRIGSRVVITKRGEIIPKIESLAENPEGTKPIAIPVTCSLCGQRLVDEGTRLYCPNPVCPGKAWHRLQKWLSVIDIKDIGEALLRRLFDSGKVRRIPDLYRLTMEDLLQFERMGEKSASKIIRHLEEKNVVSLPDFIAGFDIEGIGILMAEKLVAAGFNSLDALLSAEPQDFMRVEGFAEITANALYEGLRSVEADMRELLDRGYIRIASAAGSQEPLSGKSFCFTGELVSMKRAEAEKLVRAAGGMVRSSVTRDLSFLVTNDPASGSEKNRKAREYGIPVISEKEFLAMVGKSSQDGENG